MAVFSSALTVDCTESDEIIHVASADGARTTYPWRAVIEDEVIYVTGGVVEGLDWTVQRGADDTDKALHLAGAIVTAVRVRGAKTPEPLADDVTAEPLLDETETDWLYDDEPY